MEAETRDLDRGGVSPTASSSGPMASAGSRAGWLRGALVWAGIATLAVLALLAAAHFAADITEVLTGPGKRLVVLGRVAWSMGLVVAGAGLVLGVGWLSGRGQRSQCLALAIGLLALVLVRVILAWQLDGAHGEPDHYRSMAESLLAGEWDGRGRPPGYAVVLAGAYAVVGDRQLATEGLGLLISVLAGGVVLGMTRGLYGHRAGALALLGYAIWPAGALMSSVSMPHVAFDLMVAMAAWAAVGTPPGRRGDALSGALLGLSQYVRPLAPFLFPSWVLARLWSGMSLRGLLATVAVMVAMALVTLVPVMVYDYDRTGSLSISTSDWGGHTFFIGTYEPSGGMLTDESLAALREAAGPGATIVEQSAVGQRIAMQRFRDDPLGIAALAIRKQDTLWGTEHYGIQYALRQGLARRTADPAAAVPILVSQAFYVLMLVSATAGLARIRRRPDALVPLAITLIWVMSAMHGLLEVRDRHHAYVIPLLIPWSALAVVGLLEWLEGRLASRRGRASADPIG